MGWIQQGASFIIFPLTRSVCLQEPASVQKREGEGAGGVGLPEGVG